MKEKKGEKRNRESRVKFTQWHKRPASERPATRAPSFAGWPPKLGRARDNCTTTAATKKKEKRKKTRRETSDIYQDGGKDSLSIWPLKSALKGWPNRRFIISQPRGKLQSIWLHLTYWFSMNYTRAHYSMLDGLDSNEDSIHSVLSI